MDKKQCDQQISSISSKLLIKIMGFFEKTYIFLLSLTSHPLFSIFVALYSLVLLYFPRIFLDLIFSPVLISTGILLSTLIRLGSIEKIDNGEILASPDQGDLEFISFETERNQPEIGNKSYDKKSFLSESFVEYWNVSAPLEVIYEEHYEGQEEEDLNQMRINELASLARYYPESDTGSSSDGDFPVIEGWDSPEKMSFQWDEEDRDGLIEIELNSGKTNSTSSDEFDLNVEDQEEDNLIEIDI